MVAIGPLGQNHSDLAVRRKTIPFGQRPYRGLSDEWCGMVKPARGQFVRMVKG